MRLQSMIAVVTGGARGIGAGIARCLAAEGATVALLDLDLAGAEITAAALGAGHLALAADAADVDSVTAAVGEAASRLGGLDILVNNAGAARGDQDQSLTQPVPPFTNIDQESWDAQMANNLRSTYAGAKAAIPHLERRGGGSIINIASIAGLVPTPTLPVYGAAKAGVIHLTRSLALELAPANIRVNAICPGFLWTRAWEMLATRMKETDPELSALEPRDIFLQVVAEGVPLGREQTPEDIGKLVAFLASEDAANITGQEIEVDGGITLSGGLR